MSASTRYFSEFIGLSVLLLMTIALVAGEVDATADVRAQSKQGFSGVFLVEPFQQNFDIQLGQRALSIGIALATDMSHFRGEDE